MSTVNLYTGDSLEVLKGLEANSVDSVVCDPPYGLSFMGKKWDYDVPSVELWAQVIRVLKPGGHLLAFGGTRTYHRLVVNIEDAGFEIRDQIQWLYGSGFPKSTDVSKRIDKEAGAVREVVSKSHDKKYSANGVTSGASIGGQQGGHNFKSEFNITTAKTPDAIKYQGWGTALKPANEPICVARKPLEKGLTVAENVLKYGTGAINIDESRIGLNGIPKTSGGCKGSDKSLFNLTENPQADNSQGRWPANIILDEAAAEMLDEQSGFSVTRPHRTRPNGNENNKGWKNSSSGENFTDLNDSGGASRFFYCAKASKSERNRGMDETTNFHPTVKPIKLMEYLIRLVTPKGGTTLDPFMGSGTTGVAAKNLGFNFIGIELNPEYVEIATKRIAVEA